MLIAISELKFRVHTYLLASGFNDQDAGKLTELIIEQELVGNQFSAVGELPGKHSRLCADLSINKVEIVVDKTAVKLIKGNGRSAPLITADYLDGVVLKTKEHGMYALGIYDSTYNDFSMFSAAE